MRESVKEKQKESVRDVFFGCVWIESVSEREKESVCEREYERMSERNCECVSEYEYERERVYVNERQCVRGRVCV